MQVPRQFPRQFPLLLPRGPLASWAARLGRAAAALPDLELDATEKLQAAAASLERG